MRSISTFILLFFCVISLDANNIQVVKDGPIHEAFVTQESGNTILQAVPDSPPAQLTEEASRRNSSNAIWIPGYWSWNRDVGEFIWVSGIWRKPPPGYEWIPGRWKNYQFGWVWLKGFWSPVSEGEIEYISQPPPNPVDEKAPKLPPSSKGYFWVPGHWEWDAGSQAYQWFSGRWEILEPRMVYTPAQYYWREKGYIFVPGFWDWRLEDRGIAYAAVSIPQQEVEQTVFEPSAGLSTLFIMEHLFPYWPNYASLFQHHFYYNYDLWVSWGAIPPWWNWDSWWCLPAQDAWWLWWWWSHPGYPNPPWITSQLASQITPPNNLTLKIMRPIDPPPLVTSNGAIGSKDLIDAIVTATGKHNPILSSDPKQVEQVQDLADPRIPKAPYLRPTGTQKPQKPPLKPSTNSTAPSMKLAPGRVKLPPRLGKEKNVTALVAYSPYLHTPSYAPRMPQTANSNPNPQMPPTHTPYHNYSPYSKYSPYYDPGFESPEATQPRDKPLPWKPQNPVPPPPGYPPDYRYPQPDLQTYHLDRLTTEPQPQRNPEAPKVHPMPGDESTLPNY